jgi:hypothetical protein
MDIADVSPGHSSDSTGERISLRMSAVNRRHPRCSSSFVP